MVNRDSENLVTLIPCSKQHYLCTSRHLQLQEWLALLHCNLFPKGSRSYLKADDDDDDDDDDDIISYHIINPPHTLAIVETRSYDHDRSSSLKRRYGEPCCLLIVPICLDYYPHVTSCLVLRCYLRTLGTNSLTGVSSNQVCRQPSNSHQIEIEVTSHECELLPHKQFHDLD